MATAIVGNRATIWVAIIDRCTINRYGRRPMQRSIGSLHPATDRTSTRGIL